MSLTARIRQNSSSSSILTRHVQQAGSDLLRGDDETWGRRAFPWHSLSTIARPLRCQVREGRFSEPAREVPSKPGYWLIFWIQVSSARTFTRPFRRALKADAGGWSYPSPSSTSSNQTTTTRCRSSSAVPGRCGTSGLQVRKWPSQRSCRATMASTRRLEVAVRHDQQGGVGSR